MFNFQKILAAEGIKNQQDQDKGEDVSPLLSSSPNGPDSQGFPEALDHVPWGSGPLGNSHQLPGQQPSASISPRGRPKATSIAPGFQSLPSPNL